MLLKRLAICFMVLCAFMAIHSPAWAAAVNTQPVQAAAVINPELAQQLNLSTDQIAAIQQMVAAEGGAPLVKVESWTWLFSIVPGLGQLLMGDIMRGVLFFVGAAVLPAVLGAIWAALIIGIAPALAFLSPIIGLVGLVIWLWNLWDAYQMNQRLLGKSAEIQLMPNLRARREDGAVALRLQTATF